MVCTKYKYAQSNPTIHLHVAELFGTNSKIGNRRETDTFKPVVWVG